MMAEENMPRANSVTTESSDALLDALHKLGHGSRLLWLVFIFTITPTLFNGMHSISYVFIAEVPSHWCKIPSLTAANWTNEQVRNISSASPCSMYNYDYERFASIGFDKALEYKESHSLPNAVDCYERDFANDLHATSIVQDWDLVCESIASRSNAQMMLSLGKLLGGGFFGVFADKYGRKMSYCIGIVLLIVSGPATVIVPWYWAFLVLRMITGISHAAILYSSFTTLTEVAGAKHRQWMGVAYNSGYATGVALIAGVAYGLKTWKEIQLAISLPALFLLIPMWLMPESPRWLISENRRKEAQALIEKASRTVCETPTTVLIATVNRDSAKKQKETIALQPAANGDRSARQKVRKNIKGMQLLFSNSELRKRLCITNFAWMTASLTYYSLSLNVDNFSADRFIYVLVMGLTEIPAYLIPAPILMVLGRRQASRILYILAAACLLSILVIPSAEAELIMTVALIGRFALSAAYGIVILYTSELFPTVSRNTAVGMNSAMSHVGSVTAPYVADLLGAVIWWGPSTLCGVLALYAGILCSMLPETRNRPLANTLEEEIDGEREVVSMYNSCKCGG